MKTYLVTMQVTVGIYADSEEEAIENAKGEAFYGFSQFTSSCNIIHVEEKLDW